MTGLKSLKLALVGCAILLSMNVANANPYPPPPPPPPGAPGAPPPPPGLDACRVDVQRYCQGIRPGAGRIRACMRSNQDRLSPACKNAIVGVIEQRRGMREQRRQMREERRQQRGLPPRPPGAPMPPPPPPPPSMAPIPN